MSKEPLRIADGGEQRLREAVEAQIRKAHEDELSRTTVASRRAVTEEQIRLEIDYEMKRAASANSSWSS